MPTWQPLLDSLTRLRETWPGGPWTWDGRFAAVGSAFAIDDEAKARASALAAFPQGYTMKSLASAPPALIAFAERTGGLRAGQRLLAGGADSGGLYGLWWPWGSNDKITLRIGLLDHGADAEPMPRVLALFDVKR